LSTSWPRASKKFDRSPKPVNRSPGSMPNPIEVESAAAPVVVAVIRIESWPAGAIETSSVPPSGSSVATVARRPLPTGSIEVARTARAQPAVV
jgi:hypothetical protein